MRKILRDLTLNMLFGLDRCGRYDYVPYYRFTDTRIILSHKTSRLPTLSCNLVTSALVLSIKLIAMLSKTVKLL